MRTVRERRRRSVKGRVRFKRRDEKYVPAPASPAAIAAARLTAPRILLIMDMDMDIDTRRPSYPFWAARGGSTL